MKNILALLAGLLFGLAVCTEARAFEHPSIPLTVKDLEAIKANLNVEPWKSGYAALAADGRSQLGYTMRGPFEKVSRAPHVNLHQWRSDMDAIWNLARMWYFTGNSALGAVEVKVANAAIESDGDVARDAGALDDFRIYDQALSAAGIASYVSPLAAPQKSALMNMFFSRAVAVCVFMAAVALPLQAVTTTRASPRALPAPGWPSLPVANFNESPVPFVPSRPSAR